MSIYPEQCAHHWKKGRCCCYSFSSRCGLHKKKNRHPAISRLHSPQEERPTTKNVLRSPSWCRRCWRPFCFEVALLCCCCCGTVSLKSKNNAYSLGNMVNDLIFFSILSFLRRSFGRSISCNAGWLLVSLKSVSHHYITFVFALFFHF